MNESELVFAELLDCGRPELYQNRKHILGKSKSLQAASVLKRRIQGEPLQYILGKTEFMGLEFKVSPNVLIPRPETEILVETVISRELGVGSLGSGLRILDLGTGSGCIAVSLAKFIDNCYITAVDISAEAIAVALDNALSHGVANKINFIIQDMLSLGFAICDKRYAIGQYDFIVSNPPYIRSGDIENLQPELLYEPRMALDGGSDGLAFYRKIIDGCQLYLKKDGFLIIEIGFGQYEQIEEIFAKSQEFEIIECVKDYSGINRVIVAKYSHGQTNN